MFSVTKPHTSMRKLFTGLVPLLALCLAVSLSGCKNYGDDITNVENKNKELQAKIAILETFKSWAETQDGGFQKQIDALEAALKEANELLAGADTAPELTRRLDQLIAGSTLTIAHIQSRLEDHDEEIENLWDALDLVDGGTDISGLLQRISALEDADEDIWDAINSISFGPDGPTLAEIKALIDDLIAEALATMVKSITYIPEFSDGDATLVYAMDALKVEPTVIVQPLVMDFLVTPAAAAEILAAAPLKGILNTVTTRAISGGLTPSNATAAGGVLTVTFDIAPESITGLEATENLQIALVYESEDGNAIASEFVNLRPSSGGTINTPVTLTGFTQDGKPVTAGTTAPAWTEAPNTSALDEGETVRDGFVMLTDFTDGVALDLIGTPAEEWARLSTEEGDVTITYAVESQYVWGSAWQQIVNPTAVVTDDVVTFPAGQPTVANRVIVKVVITDSSFAAPYNAIYTGYVAVEIPGNPIELTEFTQDGESLDVLEGPEYADGWAVPGDEEGIIGFEPGLGLDVVPGPAGEFAQLTGTVATTYTIAGQYMYDTDANPDEWVIMDAGDQTVTIGAGDVIEDAGSIYDTRAIVAMQITDTDTGYDQTFHFAVDVPATLIDLENMNLRATLDTDGAGAGENAELTALDAIPTDPTSVASYTWNVASPDATATLAGVMDDESAAGVAADTPEYTYAFVTLLDADGTPAGTEISAPTVNAAGEVNRNNTVVGGSNTGYYLIVSVSVEAANDADTTTPTVRYFSILLEGGEPPLPIGGIEDLGQAGLTSGDDVLVIKTDGDGFTFVDNSPNAGNQWNDPAQDNAHTDYNTYVAEYPDNGQFTLEEQLEAYYSPAEFTITYSIIGEYTYSPSNKVWEIYTDTGVATIDTDGQIAGGVSEHRLVVRVTATIESPIDFNFNLNGTTSKTAVYYICVVLP